MIDAREQIGDELETVCSNVKMYKPDGDVELPLICYGCLENLVLNLAYTRLKWRVTVYCNTFEELIDLVNEVYEIMHDKLGYTKTYETPDDATRLGTDFYMKRLDFTGIVDIEANGVIRNSK